VPQYSNVKRAPPGPTKRSIKLGELRTSVAIEDAFWDALREIARDREVSVPNLIASIKNNPRQPNLSSAIRVFVLRHYIDQCRRRSDFGESSAEQTDRQ
jgi:predicted DNA-binding ribbon-helix-helix protein